MNESANPAFDRLAAWLAEQLETLEIPGASIGVIYGSNAWTWGHGTTRVDGALTVTPSTPFRIASVTKVFTAAAVATLARDGGIALDAPLRRHVPDFAIADGDASAAVTVAHLLSHSAGWDDVVEPDAAQNELGWYLNPLASVTSISPPGRRFSYNNSAFMVLGHLIETVTGEPFESFVRRSILDAARTLDVGFESEGHARANAANGHVPGESGLMVIEHDPVPRAVNPAAGLVGSVDGLLPFLRWNLENLDTANSGYSAMLHPQVEGGAIGPTIVEHIGLGWMLKTIGGQRIAMSLGSDAGSCAGIALAPGAGFGIVVLANSEIALATIDRTIEVATAEFLGARNAPPDAVSLDNAQWARLPGAYAMSGGVTIHVEKQDDRIVIATSAGGEAVPQFSGDLTMVSGNQGFMTAMGGAFWIDFVPGDSGTIDWLRFAARLAPRIG